MRRLLVPALAVVVAASCGDSTAPAGGLVVSAGTPEMIEGRTTPLTVTLEGTPVDPVDVQWLSRDPFIVDVENAVAHARLPGITWVVARVGGLTDSVRMTVRFSGLPSNSVGVMIANGEIEQRFTLGGTSRLLELPGGGVRTAIHATAGAPEGAPGFLADTQVYINLQGAPVLGLRTLPPYQVEIPEPRSVSFKGSEGLFVLTEHRDGDYEARFYVAVTDAPFEITEIELPPEAGRDFGRLSGRVAFEAAGWRIVVPNPTEDDPMPEAYTEPLGDRTVRIYLEFTTDFYRVPVAMSALTLTGTPYDGTGRTGGTARLLDGELVIQHGTFIDYREPTERRVESTVTIASPAAGTFDFGTSAARLNATFSIFERIGAQDAGNLILESTATAGGGSVTITDYHPPTDRVYGLVAGTYAAPLDFGAAHPDFAVTIQSEFRIPIDPLLGAPMR